MFEKVKVKEIQRSSNARRTQLTINRKMITTPLYGSLLKRKFELDLICRNSGITLPNFQMVALNIFDAHSIIMEREGNLGQKTISGEDSEKDYKHLRKTKVWCIDPCTDKYMSKNKDAFENFNGFSQETKKLILSFDEKNHCQKWQYINSDATTFMKFIRENVQLQTQNGADFIIPPAPLISASDPKYMIDVWYNIIKTTGTYSKTNLEKSTSILLNLHSNNFQTPEKLKLIIGKLSEEISNTEISDVKLIIVKIKNPILEDGPSRTRYKGFILALSKYAAATERALLLLNTDSLGLISIANGLDGFIEPLNGVIGEVHRSREKRGRYYHPEALRFYGFQALKDIYANNNRNLPCNCGFCSGINGKSIENIDTEKWNNGRRLHLLSKRNDEISECHKEIHENTISTSMLDKVQRSDIKNLLDVL